MIDELIRIYSYDVDFQRKAQAGDSFDVLYAGEEETPGVESKNDVLFASLTVGGEIKKFYRFQTTDDNVVDYYDETGKSAKKFLVRKPVNDGDHALRLRRAPPSDPRLHEDAYRRRLDRAATARRFSPPATAWSTRSAGKAATANMSASGTPTATRPPTAT